MRTSGLFLCACVTFICVMTCRGADNVQYECCVNSCDACEERTIFVENNVKYCCSNCHTGGAVTVYHDGCVCVRDLEKSYYPGKPRGGLKLCPGAASKGALSSLWLTSAALLVWRFL